jgi:hypothetical protein
MIMERPESELSGVYIWETLNNDRAQREVLAGAIRALHETERAGKNLLWAVDN